MSAGKVAALAVAGFALVALVGVLLRPPLPIDETRYLAVAWEMRLSGDWLVLHKNGALYTDKPPMLFWLINVAWALFGVSDLAARLIGPAFATATVALSGTLARRLWPDTPDVGARAVVILAGLTAFAVAGGLTMFDALLAFATVAGLIALHAALAVGGGRNWALFGVALAFGGLSKGPVILFHLLPALVFYRLWTPPGRPGPVAVLAGGAFAVAVGVALVALWVVPASIAGGPDYREAILWTQSAGRMAQSFAHERPWWFYVAVLPVLLFPFAWSPAVWKAVPRLSAREPGVRLCLVWAGAALALFSLISGKQAHYLLPELPAAALLLARALRPGDTAGWRELAALPVAVSVAAATAAALGLLPLGEAAPMLQPRPVLVAWALLALALAWASVRVGGYRGLATLGLGLVLTVNLLIGVTETRRIYDAAGVARHLRRADADGLAIFGQTYHAEFNFAGRLERPLFEVDDLDALAAWVAAHPRGRVVARTDRARLPGWRPRATEWLGGRRYAIWFVADRPLAEPGA